MSDQLPLDFFTPRQLGDAGREAGIRLAAEHAESVSPNWGDRALEVLRAYVATRPAPFTAPAFRAIAYSRGLPEPPTKFAWGGVFQRAARAKLIVHDGYEQYGDETMHTQSVSRWRAA